MEHRSGVSAERRVERFFDGRPEASAIFDALREVVAEFGPGAVRVTKSQIAFSRGRAFAWAWTPDRWLRGRTAPLVLSIALKERDPSPRWKEVIQPSPGRWMHHLELWSPSDVDDEVRTWLGRAIDQVD